MDKYLHTRIIKPFYDDRAHEIRDYAGTVVSVDWSQTEGCYLFQIDYDSDSDDEEKEHWELKKYT